MRTTTRRSLFAIAGSTLALALFGFARLSAGGRDAPLPADPTAKGPVRGLWSAVPFTLEQPFVHWWRREQPPYTSGWLLVLEVDPELVRPLQTPEPVLFAGAETVERVNHGADTGRVVAVLPSMHPGADLDAELARAPFFFAAPDLPERIDAARAASELAHALAQGARPFSAAEIAAARARGGSPLALGRREDLDALIGALVLEHSPDEHDLARGLMMPPLK
jgi:hypothetical protein